MVRLSMFAAMLAAPVVLSAVPALARPSGSTYYVDVNSPMNTVPCPSGPPAPPCACRSAGSTLGDSWAYADPSLANAIAVATLNPSIKTIKVADGTYLAGNTRAATFSIPDGLTVLGGYRGWPDMFEPYCNDPDDRIGGTVLHGDIQVPSDGNSTTNSEHIVTLDNVTGVLMDYMTIQEGYADGTNSNGGGIYAVDSSFTLSRITFNTNVATTGGGGAYFEDCNFILDDVVTQKNNGNTKGGAFYINNTANNLDQLITDSHINDDLADEGGDIYITTTSTSPVIIRTTHLANDQTATDGAYIYVDAGKLLVSACDFWRTFGTACLGKGGGVYVNSGASLEIADTIFANITAQGGGGAIYSEGDIEVYNCTVINCLAGTDSSDAPGGGIFAEDGTCLIINSIFWNNARYASAVQVFDRDGQVYYNTSNVTQDVHYTDTMGSAFVDGSPNTNISADPLLDSAYRLNAPQSPCFNKGWDASLPLDFADLDDDTNFGETLPLDNRLTDRIKLGRVDMGAKERCPCRADFDQDGFSGTEDDVAAFYLCLSGDCCTNCSVDINCDNEITDADIEAFFDQLLGSGDCAPND